MIDKQEFTDRAEAMLPSLYRCAAGMLRAPCDAEDAVQQALLKAWEKRESVRPESFRPWLQRILINQCRDMLRRRRETLPGEMPEDAYIEPRYEPENPRLTHAIYSLRESLRLPLLLKYAEGYSVAEIAFMLRLPAATIKNRLFRARRAMRRALTEEERP